MVFRSRFSEISADVAVTVIVSSARAEATRDDCEVQDIKCTPMLITANKNNLFIITLILNCDTFSPF
jgi:hypothetical protein